MKATIETLVSVWQTYRTNTMANTITGLWGSVVAVTSAADLDKWSHIFGLISGPAITLLSAYNLFLAIKERRRRLKLEEEEILDDRH